MKYPRLTSHYYVFRSIGQRMLYYKTRHELTKNWQGSDLPGHIYATLTVLMANKNLMPSFANGRMRVKYSTDVPTGKCNWKLNVIQRLF